METGDPQVSLENLKRILAEAARSSGKSWRRRAACSCSFDGGEQFYAPGLRVGTSGRRPRPWPMIAAKAEFGPTSGLLRLYRHLPESWTTGPETLPRERASGAPTPALWSQAPYGPIKDQVTTDRFFSKSLASRRLRRKTGPTSNDWRGRTFSPICAPCNSLFLRAHTTLIIVDRY